MSVIFSNNFACDNGKGCCHVERIFSAAEGNMDANVSGLYKRIRAAILFISYCKGA